MKTKTQKTSNRYGLIIVPFRSDVVIAMSTWNEIMSAKTKLFIHEIDGNENSRPVVLTAKETTTKLDKAIGRYGIQKVTEAMKVFSEAKIAEKIQLRDFLRVSKKHNISYLDMMVNYEKEKYFLLV